MNAKDPTPSQELHSREALAPVFADPNKYDATTHFVGRAAIFTRQATEEPEKPTVWRITSRSTAESDA